LRDLAAADDKVLAFGLLQEADLVVREARPGRRACWPQFGRTQANTAAATQIEPATQSTVV
jgi:hypothetical protein